MVAANDKDLSVCSLNIVISVLLGRVVGNPVPPQGNAKSLIVHESAPANETFAADCADWVRIN